MVFEAGEPTWGFDPPFLLANGDMSAIMLTLRHNRGTPTAPEWAPIDGHEIAFMVAKIET